MSLEVLHAQVAAKGNEKGKGDGGDGSQDGDGNFSACGPLVHSVVLSGCRCIRAEQ